MKIIAIFLMLLFVVPNVFAEKHYIFIEKYSVPETGEEAGQSEKGDIIDIVPCTAQYKPTKTELGRYYIIVVDLTKEQIDEWLEEGAKDGKTILFRKRKVDIAGFKSLGLNQEQEVAKIDIDNIVSVKSSQ